MPFDLFLLPLLGGFIFIRQFSLTRFSTSRLSGQRLVIWAALAGLVFLSASRVMVTLLLTFLPIIGDWWRVIIPFQYSGTAFGALFLGGILWIPANRLINKEWALDWTTQRFGSQVEILFADSFKNDKQVQVTLNSGKVLVGYVVWQPLEPHTDNSYIGILPTLSGYREAESKRVEFTTSYVPIYQAMDDAENPQVSEHLEADDFIKFFRMSDIELASIFDPDVYLHFDLDSETTN